LVENNLIAAVSKASRYASVLSDQVISSAEVLPIVETIAAIKDQAMQPAKMSTTDWRMIAWLQCYPLLQRLKEHFLPTDVVGGTRSARVTKAAYVLRALEWHYWHRYVALILIVFFSSLDIVKLVFVSVAGFLIMR
jgi:hypothetical protein